MEENKYNKDKYQEMVDHVSPNSHLLKDCTCAFVIGGLFCVVGQLINNSFINYGVGKELAGSYTAIVLIFFGILASGLGLYEKLGKYAGAGSIVPITGFANSVAAPALEFKKEGWIAGVGAKMFVIAGPVILYGTLASIVVGIVYYITNYAIGG